MRWTYTFRSFRFWKSTGPRESDPLETLKNQLFSVFTGVFKWRWHFFTFCFILRKHYCKHKQHVYLIITGQLFWYFKRKDFEGQIYLYGATTVYLNGELRLYFPLATLKQLEGSNAYVTFQFTDFNSVMWLFVFLFSLKRFLYDCSCMSGFVVMLHMIHLLPDCIVAWIRIQTSKLLCKIFMHFRCSSYKQEIYWN